MTLLPKTNQKPGFSKKLGLFLHLVATATLAGAIFADDWQELPPLSGHDDAVCAVAFSPDARFLATGSWDHTVRLWDPATLKEIAVLKGHVYAVTSLAFSPDGKTLASGSTDLSIRFWGVDTRKETAQLKDHPADVLSLAYSGDGRKLAAGLRDGSIKLWDLVERKGLFTLKGHTAPVVSVAFAPDAPTLASAASGDSSIRVWDLEKAQETRQYPVHPQNYAQAVLFSPDGKTLITGDTDTWRTWDRATGKELKKVYPRSFLYSLALSKDCKHLAAGQKHGHLEIWNLAAGSQQAIFGGSPEKELLSAAFSPDGKMLAAGSRSGTVKLCRIKGQ